MNPMISQYNTIKYALLVYRISFKIAQKKIYSLITKCSLLNNFINKGIQSYLQRQQHISMLYKFMREPIFHMTERKDSLDIMLEMNMESLLKHPVIVEVLNLVYEGKYSVDSSALNLSQTFQSFFLMQTTDLKSINDRLIQNIVNFGDSSNAKQASLQFNIWKQCIEQREADSMLFSVIVSIIVVIMCFMIDNSISIASAQIKEIMGGNIIGNQHLFINSNDETLALVCPVAKENFCSLSETIGWFEIIVLVSGIGYFAAIVQKTVVMRLKDNVELSLSRLVLEGSIVVSTALFVVMFVQNPSNELITSKC